MADLVEPKRLRILRALKAKLERIKTSNEFATDAGDHVALGRYRIGAGVALYEALPAISLTVARTTSPEEAQGLRLQTNLPAIAQALVLEDQDDPLAQAEIVVGDIKRAWFGPPFDQTLGGLIYDMNMGQVEPIPREEGSQFGGLQVEALLTFTEKRGEPEN